MSVLLIVINGKKQIVPCPEGADPEEIAASYGKSTYQFFESHEQAALSVDRDPGGRTDWSD
jgi:hypothetical protein